MTSDNQHGHGLERLRASKAKVEPQDGESGHADADRDDLVESIKKLMRQIQESCTEMAAALNELVDGGVIRLEFDEQKRLRFGDLEDDDDEVARLVDHLNGLVDLKMFELDIDENGRLQIRF